MYFKRKKHQKIGIILSQHTQILISKNIQYALYLLIFSINGEQFEKYLNNKSSVEYLQDTHSSYHSVKSKCIITFYFKHVISSKE